MKKIVLTVLLTSLCVSAFAADDFSETNKFTKKHSQKTMESEVTMDYKKSTSGSSSYHKKSYKPM